MPETSRRIEVCDGDQTSRNDDRELETHSNTIFCRSEQNSNFGTIFSEKTLTQFSS
jgi:hypothetical protein